VGRCSIAAIAFVLASTVWGQEADRTAPDPAAPAASGERMAFLSHWPVAPRMGEFQPISSGEKYRLAFRTATDPTTFFYAAATAGLGQATDSHPQLGQGMAGYGKRLGLSYTDYAVGYALAEGVFPVMLHQDPRYFRKGGGRAISRITHAIASSLVTYDDSGRRVFNTSVVAGNAAAVAVSTAYYTNGRTAGSAAGKWGLYMGYDMATNIFKEFWPDLLRKLQRK
jgi:hypothetical protein